jgi:hypothetical protein
LAALSLASEEVEQGREGDELESIVIGISSIDRDTMVETRRRGISLDQNRSSSDRL